MEYQIIWFVLWGILWAVYFMTDGFDLGLGILYPFLGKSEGEKRVMINSIGPVWDGNEVWLVTAAGATFAAFPTTYALMFSYLYSPLLIILFALIFRGVAFEFRGKAEGSPWKKGWDAAIFLGSLLPALLFGVAFGNIFQGLPMDAGGYRGSFLGLLNPYGLLVGGLFVLMFTVHGALWVAFKTEGDLSERAVLVAKRLWVVLLLAASVFMIHTAYATKLWDNFLGAPIWFVVPAVAVLAIITIRGRLSAGRIFMAFLASCTAIVTVIGTGLIGLYPNLIPSSIDPAFSLNIFNSSSSPYTLKIMTIVVLLFVPLVIAYQLWVYHIFRGKVTVEGIAKDHEAY